MSLQYYDSDNEALIPIAGNVNPSDVIELKATKADKTQLSNPNLLDNPWFTINQRGQSQYTAIGYGPDRWKLHDTNPLTVDVTADGVTLTHADNTDFSYLDQFIDPILRDKLATQSGKKVTLSVMLSDNSVYSVSGTLPVFTATNQQVCAINVGDYSVGFNVRTTLGNFWIVSKTANATISIKAVKLEMGEVSTLHLDTAPNYATELLKCQRYCVVLGGPNRSSRSLFTGFMGDATHGAIPIPVCMRAIPVATYSGNVFLRTSYADKYAITGISGADGGKDQYTFLSISIGTSLTAGVACQLRTENDGVVILSADL